MHPAFTLGVALWFLFTVPTLLEWIADLGPAALAGGYDGDGEEGYLEWRSLTPRARFARWLLFLALMIGTAFYPEPLTEAIPVRLGLGLAALVGSAGLLLILTADSGEAP